MKRSAGELGALLHVASSRLSRLGDRALRPLRVSSVQWKVLVVLARNGPCRITDLVQALQNDQGATSRLVDRMARSGLVQRGKDPDDARAGMVTLTARGRDRYRRCDRELRTVMEGLEASLQPAERVELRRLLAVFVASLDGALRANAGQRKRNTALSSHGHHSAGGRR